MQKNKESSLRYKMTRLIKQYHIYLAHFPNFEKYNLASDIRSSLYTVYGLIIECQKRYHKKTTLTNLDIEHEKLRMYSLLAFELEYFNFIGGKKEENQKAAGDRRYLYISEKIDEIGKMIGAWLGHLSKEFKK